MSVSRNPSHVAENDLELLSLPPPPSKCWVYWHAAAPLLSTVLRLELNKHSANSVASPMEQIKTSSDESMKPSVADPLQEWRTCALLCLGPQRNYCRYQLAMSKDSFLCSWQSSNKWISLAESCPKFTWGTFLQISVCKPGSDHHRCCRPGSCRELLAAEAGCFMVNLSNKASKKGFYLILYLSNSQSCE